MTDFPQHLRLVEAIIFATSEPVSMSEIASRLPEGIDIKPILEELKATYEGRGINLVERDGSYAFRTAKDLGDSLRLEKEIPKTLSKAAMETLAIIAYHQPITRPEIENIRGVAVNKGTLDLLMEEGWIAIGRRREVPGRPVTWKTTDKFLDDFGLERLKDLPGLDELKASGLLDSRPAIDIVGGETLDMFDNSEEQDDSGDTEEWYEDLNTEDENIEENTKEEDVA